MIVGESQVTFEEAPIISDLVCLRTEVLRRSRLAVCGSKSPVVSKSSDKNNTSVPPVRTAPFGRDVICLGSGSEDEMTGKSENCKLDDRVAAPCGGQSGVTDNDSASCLAEPRSPGMGGLCPVAGR